MMRKTLRNEHHRRHTSYPKYVLSILPILAVHTTTTPTCQRSSSLLGYYCRQERTPTRTSPEITAPKKFSHGGTCFFLLITDSHLYDSAHHSRNTKWKYGIQSKKECALAPLLQAVSDRVASFAPTVSARPPPSTSSPAKGDARRLRGPR